MHSSWIQGWSFPRPLSSVRSLGIRNVLHAKDFWREIEKNGPPHKDDRWCCERQKLAPVKEWLKGKGECITIQGNRWYESFARSGLPPVAKNPYYPLQVNISPIRNWRALEVFLYTWWRKLLQNPLYEVGLRGWDAGCAPRCLRVNGNAFVLSTPTCTKRGWSSWWSGAGGRGWTERRSSPVHGGGRELHPRCATDDMQRRGWDRGSGKIQYLRLFPHE